jgi:hypothetical protein
MQKQTENMLRTQERMRRMMVAQQLAVARYAYFIPRLKFRYEMNS